MLNYATAVTVFGPCTTTKAWPKYAVLFKSVYWISFFFNLENFLMS